MEHNLKTFPKAGHCSDFTEEVYEWLDKFEKELQNLMAGDKVCLNCSSITACSLHEENCNAFKLLRKFLGAQNAS